MKLSNINRILVIKYSAIGDLIMSTPAFRSLKKAYPNAKISLLIGKWSLPIIENNPNIDEFIVVDDDIFAKKKIAGLLGLILKLRKNKYDLVISFHRSLAMSLFSRLVGGRNTLGFDRNGEGRFYSIKTLYDKVNGLHESEKFLELIKEVGGSDEELKFDFYYKDSEEKRVLEIMKENKLVGNGAVVAFLPGGGVNPSMSFEQKRWPIENWTKLGDLLKENMNAKIVTLGSKSEAKICQEAINSMSSKEGVNDFCGKISLREASIMLNYVDILITPDSSLMHVASALNTKTIALFGPTDPKNYAPPNIKVIKSSRSCSPCYIREGKLPKCKEYSCMKEITPEEVYKQIKEVYNARKIRKI